MKKNNNFLITGATSFTGNNFIQTNNIYNYLAYIKGNKNNSDNIEYVSDLNILSEKIKDKSIDTCIHIANFKDKMTSYKEYFNHLGKRIELVSADDIG